MGPHSNFQPGLHGETIFIGENAFACPSDLSSWDFSFTLLSTPDISLSPKADMVEEDERPVSSKHHFMYTEILSEQKSFKLDSDSGERKKVICTE